MLTSNQESSVRLKLLPYLNQKHRPYIATFARYDVTPQGRATVLLTDVIDWETEEWLTDHIWIPRSSIIKGLHPKEGHRLFFKAKVIRYAKGHTSNLQHDYRFDRIQDVRIVRKSVSINDLKDIIRSDIKLKGS